MTTSGTIGQTTFKTVKLIEKALRRCGLPSSVITPEIVEIARDDLFLYLTSDACRGLNLWCIDKQLFPLVQAKASYLLPAGTIDLLNVMHAVPTRVTGTDTSSATFFKTTLSEDTKVVRIGIKFSVAPTLPFTLQSSEDDSTWTTLVTVSTAPTLNQWAWYDIDPADVRGYFRANSVAIGTVSDFYLASAVREIEVTPFNRDDYANQPDKTIQSSAITNFYLEKTVTPKITLWPVPNDDTAHLVIFRYRQIQDIGSLTQEIEIPIRWFEPICWQLTLRLAFELEGVDPARRAEIGQIAGHMTLTVEGAETDHAPINLSPNIAPYTK